MLRQIHLIIPGVVLLAVSVLAVCAPYISPVLFWPPLFAGYVWHFLLAGNILLLLVWINKFSRWTWLPIFGLLLNGFHFNRNVGTTLRPSPDDIEWSLVTFNTQGMQQFWTGKRKGPPADQAKTKSLFQNISPPDILCLQEVPASYKVKGEDWGMEGADAIRFRSIVILSRFPIRKIGNKVFGSRGNAIVWADVTTPSGKVRLFNVHLQSHRISKEADHLVHSVGNEDEQWTKFRTILGRTRHFTKVRAGQAEWLSIAIAESPHPVIVAGDLNDTPQSYTYHQLTRDLEDSFRKGGRGIGTTFAGVIPGLRIDHILADPVLGLASHRVIRTDKSDHYPVMAGFCKPKK